MAAVVATAIGLLAATLCSAQVHAGAVRVDPATAEIGFFYSGQPVRVQATVANGHAVAVRITGPEESLVLKRKGKKLGLVWMNVGEVRYDGIPSVYLLRSSEPLNRLADPAARKRLGIGFQALKERLREEGQTEAAELFDELVKLKQKDGLYACRVGDVRLRRAGRGQQEVTSEIFLPPKAPVGDYQVDVFVFGQGGAQRAGGATFHLERSPAVAFIVNLAREHGLLYGGMAVAIAVVAGLGIGMLFGKGKGASH